MTAPQVGFIGLGNIGSAMARRLLDSGVPLAVFDIRSDAMAELESLGAQPASSPRELADRVPTILASLPTPQVCLEVATGERGVARGSAVKRFVDLSTTGASTSQRIQQHLAAHGVAHLDSPVSGGVPGARDGTLALMVSGPRAEVRAVTPVLEILGTHFFLGERPGAGQTMKLVNNLVAATVLAATAEAVVLGVKAGLDPGVMLDVLNAGSGATTASRDKFPRAVLNRRFDYGFATGLMAKDVRLCLQQAAELGLSLEIADAVGRVWEDTVEQMGPDSDFTSVIRPIEDAAGVTVGRSE